LAVQSIDELDSCRHVRALLINGADPNIKNHNNQTPFDMINDVQDVELRKELESILKQS
jgi:ankyrin repeat protein